MQPFGTSTTTFLLFRKFRFFRFFAPVSWFPDPGRVCIACEHNLVWRVTLDRNILCPSQHTLVVHQGSKARNFSLYGLHRVTSITLKSHLFLNNPSLAPPFFAHLRWAGSRGSVGSRGEGWEGDILFDLQEMPVFF